MGKIQTTKTQIIRINSDRSKWNGQVHDLQWAAKIITEGNLVAFPTDTVYGLGGDAYNPAAIRKIFEVKGRPPNNPLIVHVATIKDAMDIARFNEYADILSKAFWPGALTMVLPNLTIPSVVTADSRTEDGCPTVAVRMPNHAVALELISLSGVPIAAPSANMSGKPSTTKACHVLKDLRGKIPLIIDSGQTQIGIESTVINLCYDSPVILRAGGVTKEQIETALKKEVRLHSSVTTGKAIKGEPAPSPGMLHGHYSPKADIILFGASKTYGTRLPVLNHMIDVAGELNTYGKKIAFMISNQLPPSLIEKMKRNGIVYPHSDALQLAHGMFDEFRCSDAAGVDVIIIEGVPPYGIGRGVMERVLRAADKEPQHLNDHLKDELKKQMREIRSWLSIAEMEERQ